MTIKALPENIQLEEDELRQANDKTLLEKALHYGRIMRAQEQAITQLHRRLDEAVEENAALARQRDAAAQNSQLQIQTTAQHIAQSSSKEAKLTDEIMRLRGLLRRARRVVPAALAAEIKAAL